MPKTLIPQALTSENFAPFGEVIESAAGSTEAMNAARFERFDDLCGIEMSNGGRVTVSIARCLVPSSLPYRIDMLERHPLGSQAFVPLTPARMVVVVAPVGESVASGELCAFVSNGRQGINYRRGTWHMPLIAFDAGQEFLIIDRVGDVPNCEEFQLDDSVMLVAAE